MAQKALFSIFVDTTRPNSAYGDQETAGRLLIDLETECSQSLEDILKGIASTWNVSVEQLPFYLRNRFGADAVNAAASRLKETYPDGSREQRAMETVCWWLKGG